MQPRHLGTDKVARLAAGAADAAARATEVPRSREEVLQLAEAEGLRLLEATAGVR